MLLLARGVKDNSAQLQPARGVKRTLFLTLLCSSLIRLRKSPAKCSEMTGWSAILSVLIFSGHAGNCFSSVIIHRLFVSQGAAANHPNATRVAAENRRRGHRLLGACAA